MARLLIALALLPHATVAQGTVERQLPPDMACSEGPRAAQWNSVKKRFRALFDNRPEPFAPVPTDDVVAAVKGALADIETVQGFARDTDAVNECGFGKLFVQLLSLTTVDDPSPLAQYFQEHPAMASPVMTMLLDIPFLSMAQSGWPFLAILAHFSSHKVKLLQGMLNQEAIDGLQNEVVKAYFDAMSETLQKNDVVAMATASNMYLRSPPPDSAYATLTAIAASSAIEMNLQQRLDSIQALQDGLRQTVSTPQELDIALTIRWPLWSLLHASVDVFADA
jgi:hypothetical protein